MIRLDYISCLLTVLSTVLIGRHKWHGWIVAGANSILICVIGLKTAQTGFIAANLFCIGIYVYNLVKWRAHPVAASQETRTSDRLTAAQCTPVAEVLPGPARAAKDAYAIRHRHRILPRRLFRQRKSRASF